MVGSFLRLAAVAAFCALLAGCAGAPSSFPSSSYDDAGVTAPAGPRPGGRRYNRSGPSQGNTLATADKAVSAPKRPEVPGTKF